MLLCVPFAIMRKFHTFFLTHSLYLVCVCMRANIIFENGIACMHETNSSNGKIIIYYLCWTCFSMNLLYIFSLFPHSHIIHCYTIFAFTPRIRVPRMPRINNNNIDDDENVNLILEASTQSWRVEAVWIIDRRVLSLELLTCAMYIQCVCVFVIQYATFNFDVPKN